MVVRMLVGCLLLGACEGATPRASSAPHPSTAPAEPEASPQAGAHEAPAPSPPPEVARPYDEGVDAQAAIDAAVAGAEGRRVLLVFGANWCPWCRRLEHTLRNDARIAAKLAEKFRLVHVDVGPRDSSVNRDLARRYGDPLAKGLPCLVVLDERGAVEHVQETGVFERGDRHDPERILAFLQTWEP